jgi:chromosome segregation ATPase
MQKDVEHLKEAVQRHKQQQQAETDRAEKLAAAVGDLKVAMQHEEDKYQQLYESYHHLLEIDKRRQQEVDELLATIKAKDEAAGEASREREELKERVLHYEHKLEEHAGLLDELKARLDDTKQQLSAAAHRIDDLLKDKETIASLKRALESKEAALKQLQEKAGKLEIEAVHYQHSLDRLQADHERCQSGAAEMRGALEKKELDILTMVEERDDLFQKANDLEERLLAMDRIQTEDIDRLENHVDDIVAQLGMARRDNEQLAHQAADLRLRLEDAEHRHAEMKEKYYHKKSEANVLRDKLERLAAENHRLAAQTHQVAASSKQATADHRHKAYRDIRSIIEEFKHQPDN